jgi:Flp pilus assembly protein TadD
LAACNTAGGQKLGENPFGNTGVDTHGQAVDGLTVGHRLMQAGEYDLALKAYLRSATEIGVNVDVLSAIGSANLKLGRLGQAETLLRQAVKLDETFVPAWNNLGVVLMETGKTPEAAQVFKRAFALDSGETAEIAENLRLALAKLDQQTYSGPVEDHNFALMRRGSGEYLLLSTPQADQVEQ